MGGLSIRVRVGGGNGWYAADILWKIRGWMDQLVGGPGLRRGRRDSETVGYGEALDFWRVVGFERDRRLALRAEMKLPGEALLEFRIEGTHRPSMRFAAVSIIPSERLVRLGLLVHRAAFPRHRVQGHANRHQTGSSQDCGQSPEYGFRNFDLTRNDCGKLAFRSHCWCSAFLG